MYGPCQHWNQWDASCFNLAWEPSGSRSSASWKSDGSGLSFFCLYSLPYPLLCCIDQHLAPIGQSTTEAHTIQRPQRTSGRTTRLLTCSGFASLPIDEVSHNLGGSSQNMLAFSSLKCKWINDWTLLPANSCQPSLLDDTYLLWKNKTNQSSLQVNS